ncbi:hypothetical protein MPER_07959, partial [Moniliophthora perniciosa FA553]
INTSASDSSELPNIGIAPSDTTLSSTSYDKALDPPIFDANINFTDLYLLNSLSNGISVVDPSASHLSDSYSGAQQPSNSLSGLDGLGLDFTNFVPDSWSTEPTGFEGLDSTASSLTLRGCGLGQEQQLFLPISAV